MTDKLCIAADCINTATHGRWCKLHFPFSASSSEINGLIERAAAMKSERDKARKQLATIKEIADEELRRGSAGMWHQVEAEARHGLPESDKG